MTLRRIVRDRQLPRSLPLERNYRDQVCDNPELSILRSPADTRGEFPLVRLSRPIFSCLQELSVPEILTRSIPKTALSDAPDSRRLGVVELNRQWFGRRAQRCQTFRPSGDLSVGHALRVAV